MAMNEEVYLRYRYYNGCVALQENVILEKNAFKNERKKDAVSIYEKTTKMA